MTELLKAMVEVLKRMPEVLKGMLEILKVVVWPALALAFFIKNSVPLRRMAEAIVQRVERGDKVKFSKWLTLGKSVGPLTIPQSDDLITDDHLALIHRSWRVWRDAKGAVVRRATPLLEHPRLVAAEDLPAGGEDPQAPAGPDAGDANPDKGYDGKKWYQIHVILFGTDPALDRVQYVMYRLDPAYPDPVQFGGSRATQFELKELANGYSLIRAEVKIKNQREVVHLSRFIDLTERSYELKGGPYLK